MPGVILGVELMTCVDPSDEAILVCFLSEPLLLVFLLLLMSLLLLNKDSAADCVRNLKAPLPMDHRLVRPSGLLPRVFAEMRMTGVRLNGEV